MPRKQIELWDITSTSGNFRPYQIQTANIHFKFVSAILYSTQHFDLPFIPLELNSMVILFGFNKLGVALGNAVRSISR